MDSADTETYGLIGFPLTHSFSQGYFNRKFESEGVNARYENFEIDDIGRLMEIIASHPSLKGLNVTIPYKEQVIPYMDAMDPVAAETGAVNVIKIIRKPESAENEFMLKGYNSDIIGFRESIAPLLTPAHNKALVLGTGGASKAVVCALRQLRVEPQPVSRTPREGVLCYDMLDREVMASHKVIVNTTPLGMYPNTGKCPDIPYELIDSDCLCYDLIYNPDTTLFMQRARENGAVVKNGLEMLLLQAIASWKIWNE